MILKQNKPWMVVTRCYMPARLSLVMHDNLQQLPYQYMHYASVKDAFEDFIWTVNINPAYASFRRARKHARLSNKPLDIKKMIPLINPNRSYQAKYYRVQ